MPEYLAPGVFIEEIERGPKPIEGVATSTAAFLGVTERGPLRPFLVTSYGEYVRRFGEIVDPPPGTTPSYMPHAVKAFFDNGGKRCFITRISRDLQAASGAASVAEVDAGGLKILAFGPGTAYNRVWIVVSDSSTKNGAGQPIGFRLRVFYWNRDAAGVPYDPTQPPPPGAPGPTDVEDFDNLSIDPASPFHYDKIVNHDNSRFIRLEPDLLQALPPATSAKLHDGEDGDPPIKTDYEGSDQVSPTERVGLAALDLDEFRSVAIVHAPAAAPEVVQSVITHCERNRFRFAVIDSDANQGNISALDPRTDLQDTKYAAFYYPWIWVSDPRSGRRIKVPPGGSVCGIYALTDETRGVFKAPANEVVAGALDLEFDINDSMQGLLNPNSVNVLRRFPGRGIRVWGARTLASDPLWKYVPVRRLFIFLEASIYNSTQWVVFEPNDDKLWARVKQSVTLFLRTQWREGALLGAKEEDAFHVAVGRGETMSEDDILNGRLIVEVGIAPVRPAEFVIFRVYQKTQEAK